MNILVLTTRNIYGNSGEYSLMVAKDKALKKHNIDLIYYSFRRKFNKFKDQNFNIIKQDSMYNLLFKKKQIKKNIETIINHYNINIIVVSGNWILFLYKELESLKEQYNIKLSYDYQGAIEEVKEYALFKNNQFLSNILFNILKRHEKLILNIIDGVEAVSQNAIDHLKSVYSPKNDFSEVLIHCGIENPIEKKDYEKFRELWRSKYNIKNDEIIYVYAGGIAKWQNIDEIIEQAKDNDKIKLFIYTSMKNQEFLKENYELSSNIFFDYLSHEELQKALCAFDYGYLLRNKDITNYVAFPNKFSDYINARLTVINKNDEIGYYSKQLSKDNITQSILDFKSQANNTDFERYISYFSYETMIPKLVKYYKEL